MDDLDVTEKTPRSLDSDAPSPTPRINITMPGGPELVALSSRRAALGTRTRVATLPPPLPQRANRGSTAPPIGYPIVRTNPIPPPIPPQAARGSAVIATASPEPLVAPIADVVSAPIPGFDVEVDTEDDDFAAAPMPSFHIDVDHDDDHDVGNIHEVNLEPAAPRRNLAPIIGIGVGLGMVALVLAVALHGDDRPVAKPRPVARLAPPILATPTVPVPVPAPAPSVALAHPATALTIPITSNPTGATVTVIDDGDATVIGRTPITAVLEPARSYELVVAMHGHPTKIQRVAPHDTQAIDVELQPAAATVPAPKRVAPVAPVAHQHAAPAPTPAKPTRTATAGSEVAAASTSTGVLMISSKPPCNIAIDGKPTKMVTPQRAIALSPGAHSITLTNSQEKIQKTIAVRITAKQSTKLIQDFTK